MKAWSSPDAAWRRFREQVEEQGGRVIEEHWLGANTPHHIICGQGHTGSRSPSNARRSGRICAVCSLAARPGPAASRQRFREQVEACGGRVVEPRWLGMTRRHRVICAAGHETAPVPAVVDRTGGICRICSGNDPEVSERYFRSRLVEAGAELLEPYGGAATPVLVRCAQGHETKRRPDSVRRGRGCRVCARCDKDTAWRLFCELVAEKGGRVLEPEPLGSNRQHRVLCPEGHETKAIPSRVRTGTGICGECSPVSTTRAEREFRAIVASLGGRIIEPSWLGSTKPHRVVCVNGHEVTPRPADVLQGHGICRKCKDRIWDVFYVAASESLRMVKFGITSRDARSRLRRHRADGFETVIMTISDLADAPDLERAVISALRLSGLTPAQGRECFGMDALPVILDIAVNWTQAADAA